MKKLIAMLFVIALCVPAVFADGEHKVMSASNATFTTVYSTPSSGACELAYIIVETTGAAAARTVTIRDNATTKFTISVGTSADTKVIDLSNTPVLFATNLNVVASAIDGGCNVTVVYRKKN